MSFPLSFSSAQESCSSWFIARLLYKEPVLKKLIHLATNLSSEEYVENKVEIGTEEKVEEKNESKETYSINVEYKLEDVASSAMHVLSRMIWTTYSKGKNMAVAIVIMTNAFSPVKW